MRSESRSSIDPVRAAKAVAVCVGTLSFVVLLVEWPTLVWSSLQFRPALVNPALVGHAALSWAVTRQWSTPASWAGIVPSFAVGVILDVVLLVALGWMTVRTIVRLNRWGGRSRLSLHPHDPRRKVKSRAFAKPLDWAHLQPAPAEARSGPLARVVSGPARALAGERERPSPRGGDGWNMGLVREREVRSGPEQHMLAIAPTRSGKSMRIVGTEAHEHDGALVITSNKLDVLLHTIAARARRGMVAIYAPLSDLPGTLRSVAWSPLRACHSWAGALRMGQWLHDADPGAGEGAKGDGAAQFYDRQAVERCLPPLLHAAALAGLGMVDVYSWLLMGAEALDQPGEILTAHQAQQALLVLRSLQAMDPKPQSFVLMSAAQLLSAYRLPEVQDVDRPDFDVEDFLEQGGTLYLIAPESEQTVLAPLFGGLLGELLRACERRANRAADPRTVPLVKILADEAAHLAPLGKLPTYLSVAASWGIRFCVIYQSEAQLRARYGVEADTIIANALVKVYLGPIHDRSTRDQLLALLGETTVEQVSETSDRFGGESSRTRHEQPRPKLGAEQLAQLGDGEAIVIHGKDLPAIVRLPFWWEWQGCSSPQEAIERARQHEQEEGGGER